jgi:hypothetical protein
MISIKSLIDQRRNDPEEQDLLGAPHQWGRLLLEGMATHLVPGRVEDRSTLRRRLTQMAQELEGRCSALDLLSLSNDAVVALETYCQRTTAYLSEEKEHLRSMVAMLMGAVVDIAGQIDASVARLQSIENQVERATKVEDSNALRVDLEQCLLALREAVVQQRRNSTNVVEALQNQIDKAQPRIAIEPQQQGGREAYSDHVRELAEERTGEVTSFVASFKLRRAEHIVSRFGEDAQNEMITRLGKELEKLRQPQDRLVRWKGPAYVMLLNTTETNKDVRLRLARMTTTIGQQYIEVGVKNSALLKLGVEWAVFSRAQYSSLEALLSEVEAFLVNTNAPNPLVGA